MSTMVGRTQRYAASPASARIPDPANSAALNGSDRTSAVNATASSGSPDPSVT